MKFILIIPLCLLGVALILAGVAQLPKKVDETGEAAQDVLLDEKALHLPSTYNFFEMYPACLRVPHDENKDACKADWVMAPMGMISYRFCKRVHDLGFYMPDYSEPSQKLQGTDYRWATQPVLSCLHSFSPSINSCKGGQPQLVLQWLQSNWVPAEKCSRYTATDSPQACQDKGKDTECLRETKDLGFSMSDPVYFMGSLNIRNALVTNGPVAASMRTPHSFLSLHFRPTSDPTFVFGRYDRNTKMLSHWAEIDSENEKYTYVSHLATSLSLSYPLQ